MKFSENKAKLITFNNLSEFNSLRHFTTTRIGLPLKSSRFTNISDSLKKKNLETLSGLTNIDQTRFVFPKQVHSSEIEIIESYDFGNIGQADALITTQKGVCLCIQTADCVPILIFCPDKKAIAAVHAGWRGTVSKIVQKTIEILVTRFEADPGKIIVSLGPSIKPNVYEVGYEVIKQVELNIPKAEFCLQKKANNKALLNLHQANKNLLLNMGIIPGNIESSEFCSFSNGNLFYSARREGPDTGRMVSGIMLV